jgi:hypothetical protein
MPKTRQSLSRSVDSQQRRIAHVEKAPARAPSPESEEGMVPSPQCQDDSRTDMLIVLPLLEDKDVDMNLDGSSEGQHSYGLSSSPSSPQSQHSFGIESGSSGDADQHLLEAQESGISA